MQLNCAYYFAVRYAAHPCSSVRSLLKIIMLNLRTLLLSFVVLRHCVPSDGRRPVVAATLEYSPCGLRVCRRMQVAQ
jgi:hypothetical protein